METAKYYSDLSLPYRVFCGMGDNPKVLCYEGIPQDVELKRCYMKIKKQYFDIFGISQTYRNIILLDFNIIVLRERLIKKKDITIMNEIRRKEAEREILRKEAEHEGENPDQTCAELSALGFGQYNADMPARVIFGAIMACKKKHESR